MYDLDLIKLGAINKLASPNEKINLNLKSSALEFFTDFTVVEPLVIESNISAVDVMLLMKKAHVRLKLVLDGSDNVIGIVSCEDLLERKITQKLTKGDKREDILVEEFMIPSAKLNVLEYEQIANSNISTVIKALQHSGQQHCLVIEEKNKIIRGLFSVSDISRKLKVEIDIHDQPSFIKLANHLD